MVPLLTPKLSSYWIHLITPVPASIARPLTQGLSIPVICKDNRIRSIIPHTPLSCREAIRIALERIKNRQVETCWTDAGCLLPPEWAVGSAGFLVEAFEYLRHPELVEGKARKQLSTSDTVTLQKKTFTVKKKNHWHTSLEL